MRGSAQHGFSMIDLMVGIVLGMLTVLAITQVYAVWSAQHRTISSKSDSQMTGVLASYGLGEDLRQAAQGFGPAASSSDIQVGCTVTATYTGGATPTAISFPLLPVVIVEGANGAPDQVNVLYGNSSYLPLRNVVISSTASLKFLPNTAGINAGDLVVLTSASVGNTGSAVASPCQLVEVTSTNGTSLGSNYAIAHQTGSYQSFYQPSNVLTTATLNTAAGTGTSTFTELFDLGPNPQANQWSVSTTGSNVQNPVLQKLALLPSNGVLSTTAAQIAEGVVNLQAQYGYDLNNDGQISSNEWVNADANGLPVIGAQPLNWNAVLAMRYAILTRSREYEVAPYVAKNPIWAGGPFVMTDLGGATDTNPQGPTNWRSYRYSVYEEVIPLRNVLWGQQL